MANWIWFTRAHCAVYRGTRGIIGENLIGIHMLLLTTKGRKSGLARTLPLAYVEDRGDFIVVASNGGAEKPPAWWLNLQASEIATLQVGQQSFWAKAEVAPAERRDALWSALRRAIPPYRVYERIEREIPIVLLRRLRPGEGSLSHTR